jgi:hypothetical protein
MKLGIIIWHLYIPLWKLYNFFDKLRSAKKEKKNLCSISQDKKKKEKYQRVFKNN